MKVYISGPISGVDNFKENFQKAEDFLSEKGLEVVNPVKIGEALQKDGVKLSYHDFMRADIVELMKCDAIYLLENWKYSSGANCEYIIAQSLGLLEIKNTKGDSENE